MPNARKFLTEDEYNDSRAIKMIVETRLVKDVMGVDKSMMGSEPAYQFKGGVYYEYRSTQTLPNSNKYLGLPLSPPPVLNTKQIYEILLIIYPQANPKYKPNYNSDPSFGGNDQIIFDGYQFLTPRDANMIKAELFTTLSLHNKLISLFRIPEKKRLENP